jgi:hypothetical protein
MIHKTNYTYIFQMNTFDHVVLTKSCSVLTLMRFERLCQIDMVLSNEMGIAFWFALSLVKDCDQPRVYKSC